MATSTEQMDGWILDFDLRTQEQLKRGSEFISPALSETIYPECVYFENHYKKLLEYVSGGEICVVDLCVSSDPEVCTSEASCELSVSCFSNQGANGGQKSNISKNASSICLGGVAATCEIPVGCCQIPGHRRRQCIEIAPGLWLEEKCFVGNSLLESGFDAVEIIPNNNLRYRVNGFVPDQSEAVDKFCICSVSRDLANKLVLGISLFWSTCVMLANGAEETTFGTYSCRCVGILWIVGLVLMAVPWWISGQDIILESDNSGPPTEIAGLQETSDADRQRIEDLVEHLRL